nr:helix-turn-helix domain-containing protein [Shewanella insulae]
MILSDVLSRVGKLSNVSTDAEIANVLGVSPQTLSTWKRRGTIPYERICNFAASKDVSLDYLLLGVSARSYLGGLDPLLLEGIGLEFEAEAPEFFTIHNVGLIYNRVIKLLEPNDNWTKVIEEEVAYFAQISHAQSRVEKGKLPPVYEEESRVFKKEGIDSNEVFGGSKNDDMTSVTQYISGNKNEVAGRDIVKKTK